MPSAFLSALGRPAPFGSSIFGVPSYWDVTLTSSPYYAGQFDGWCVNPTQFLAGSSTGVVDLFSSYSPASGYTLPNPALPPVMFSGSTLPDPTARLDNVNWLLNQQYTGYASGFSWSEVQTAIWRLLGFTQSLGVDATTIQETDVVTLVNNSLTLGEGFVPGADGILGVLLEPTFLYQGTSPAQPVLIETRFAKLGDFVWEDQDADGVQDGVEPGVNGVAVTLTGTDVFGAPVLRATTTGDNPATPAVESGFYLFDRLVPGDYQVTFTKPAGFISFTKPDAVPPGTDSTDSDANPASGATPVVVLKSGEDNRTIDAGLLRPATIGDFVWRDRDGDGVQDTGEFGVPGVTVTLTGTDALGNAVTRTTTTNPSGLYLFNGSTLLPGTYKVTFSGLPAGLAFTTPNAGGDDTRDSDADPVSGMTPFTTVGSGGIDLTLDGGLVGTGIEIIKRVNGDDANVPTGPVLAVGSTATFTYEVRNTGDVSLAALSVRDDNGTPANPADDFTPAFTGGDSNANSRLDLGEVWTYAASRIVVAGQYTNIARTTGTPVYPSGTPVPGLPPPSDDDPANHFGESRDFGDLPSPLYAGVLGGYHVFADQRLRLGASDTDAEPAAQPNASATGDDLGGGDDESGVTLPATIVAGTTSIFNVAVSNSSGAAATLVGFVDWNRDGDFLDANESVATPVASGFSGSVPLSFAVPAGAVTGLDLGARFRISTSSGLGATTPAPDGEVEDYLVQASALRASLGNFVWDDLDADGVQDAGEPGVTLVTVTLTGGGADGVINGVGDTTATLATDAGGFYQFTNLNPSEQYRVSFARPAAYISFTKPDAVPPGTDATDSDADAAGVTPIVTLAPGENNDTIDAGLLRPATIGDFVWRDRDGDGVQDTGEFGVPGVTVTLTGTDALGNAVTRTTTTNPSGLYLFNGSTLLPGTYKVTFSGLPAGLAFTTPNAGGDDTRDSDADPVSGMTPFTTVGSGGIDLTLDGGLVGTGIEIIKRVNGDDANVPTGPVLAVGSTATFTYEVRNTGDVSLAALSLRDDNGTPANPADDFTPAFTGGDSNANSRLDLGEVWTYAASRIVVAGQYTNIARTTGTPVYPSGTPVPGLPPPSDDDPANHFGESRDFGDLPSPLYAGVLGGYHVFADQRLRLGASDTDAEPAAQPNASATGDDLGGGDDESGVTLPATIVAGTTSIFNVAVSNSSGAAATLVGFVDWNRDGDFLDANESVAAPVASGFSGSVPLSFAVPAGAVTGLDLGARFRISTNPALDAVTPAGNGEVEDYLVQATAPPAASIDLVKTARIDVVECPNGPIGGGNDGSPGTPGVQPVAGIELGGLTDFLMFFANGSVDANWQGATKGFAGDVAVDGIQARERTSGGVPFAGTIYTNDTSLGAWQGIVDQNPGQAFGVTGQSSLISGLEADLIAAIQQINVLPATTGYASRNSTSLNGLNTQNGVNETFVVNVTAGLGISSKINITGDAGDVFVMRWDTDANASNGYQGQVKFQSGGAIVPLGGLQAGNFIHVAGDMNASGGGSTPAAPYPQGPRTDDGQGGLVDGGKDFSGGGFFTGYWLSTGKPTTLDPASGLYIGETAPFSNGIFVGGWYTLSSKFSMTSGTSGVHVCPNLGTLTNVLLEVDKPFDPNNVGIDGGTAAATLGDLITYTFKVTNTGAVPLSNVKVGDDNTTPANPADDYFAAAVLKANGRNFGDANDNALLDPTEVWYYQAKDYATATGNFTNTATVFADHAGGLAIDTDVALVGISP